MSTRFREFRWPTPAQLLLLRAATGDAAAAAAAWDAWRATNNLDSIDALSQRLVPQLAENLRRHRIETPESARLKGLLHRAWYENKLAIHDATAAIDALRSAGIESMLLKGGALLATRAGDSAARSMSDVDLLVRERDASRAVAVLCEAGWRPAAGSTSLVAVAALRSLHAVELRSAAGRPLDLHRTMLEDNPRPGADEGAWRRSREAMLGDSPVRIPSPEDLLVAVCVHGTRATPGPTLRWALDARDIVERSPSPVDWALVVRIARERRSTLAMEEALAFLRQELGVPVPQKALASLAATRRGWLERLDYRAQGTKDRVAWAVISSFTRYLRQSAGRGPIRTATGFPRFFQHLWGLEYLRDVPREGFRRVRRHITGRHHLRAQRS